MNKQSHSIHHSGMHSQVVVIHHRDWLTFSTMVALTIHDHGIFFYYHLHQHAVECTHANTVPLFSMCLLYRWIRAIEYPRLSGCSAPFCFDLFGWCVAIRPLCPRGILDTFVSCYLYDVYHSRWKSTDFIARCHKVYHHFCHVDEGYPLPIHATDSITMLHSILRVLYHASVIIIFLYLSLCALRYICSRLSSDQ